MKIDWAEVTLVVVFLLLCVTTVVMLANNINNGETRIVLELRR